MTRARAWLTALALLPALSCAHTAAQEAGLTSSATNRQSVKAVADQRLRVTTAAGSGMLPVYLSHDWAKRQPGVSRAVLIFHGRSRNADSYYRYGQIALAAAAQTDNAVNSNTLLVAPQFLAEIDVRAHHLAADTLRWNLTDWEGGAAARGPAAISSYEAVDAILAKLADRELFPALKLVVVAGHSGGGQVVQRYAVVGRGVVALAAAGVKLRLVIANPSSYLYFSPERPTAGGGFAMPTNTACAGYNRWKYGWEDAPPYAKWATAEEQEHHYLAEDVVYLLGTADNDPRHPALDQSCSGELQGPYRLARGLSYAAYIRQRHPAVTHRVWGVEGIGHDGERMLTSTCGIAALFDIGTCDPK